MAIKHLLVMDNAPQVLLDHFVECSPFPAAKLHSCRRCYTSHRDMAAEVPMWFNRRGCLQIAVASIRRIRYLFHYMTTTQGFCLRITAYYYPQSSYGEKSVITEEDTLCQSCQSR